MAFVSARILTCAVLPALALLAASPCARADWTILPESHHHLFESNAFFIEHHDTVVYRGEGRYWAAVAANLPLAGNDESPYHPQILFHFSGNDSMHLDSQGGVYTETLDTRIGFVLDFTLQDPTWKFWVGFFHESGHVADGDTTPALYPLNLGLNVIWLRALKDFDRNWRIGINAFPVVHTIPSDVVLGLSEFAEWFPWGSNEDHVHPSPYLAASVGHKLSFDSNYTLDMQVGLALGPHFTPAHAHSARLVLGYFDGPDPRAKYAEFLLARATFGYFGLMFDI